MCYAPAAQWIGAAQVVWQRQRIHNTFTLAVDKGFFLALWQGRFWPSMMKWRDCLEWQSIDGNTGKAPLAQEAVGNKPHDRGKKKGSKRSLLVDGAGVPLSLIVSGANRHDVNCWRSLWTALWSYRPKNLAAVGGTTCVRTRAMRGRPRPRKPCKKRGYTPQCADCAEKKLAPRRKGQPQPRPLGGFRTHALVVQPLPQLLVRYEKTAANFLALLQWRGGFEYCWRMC